MSARSQQILAERDRNLRTCTECGYVGDVFAEYHPYAFCVLVKAGLDPWEVIREAVATSAVSDGAETE